MQQAEDAVLVYTSPVDTIPQVLSHGSILVTNLCDTKPRAAMNLGAGFKPLASEIEIRSKIKAAKPSDKRCWTPSYAAIILCYMFSL